MNRKVKVGRPSIASRSSRGNLNFLKKQEFEKMYIADDSDCEQIFQLFAKQSSYKNITKTGPRKQYKHETDNSEIIQCNQKLKELLKEIQLSEDTIFFIAQRKRDFVFENDILIDKTVYAQIKHSIYPEYNSIIAKLNVVVKELDDNFIRVLEIIVEKYIQEKQRGFGPDQISKNLVNFIRMDSIEDEECYVKLGYLRNWELLKESSKKTRLDAIEQEILARKQQINAKQSKKVKERHEDLIQKQLMELNEELNCTSIQYLIQNLVQFFEQILQKDQIKDEEQ